MKAPILVVDDDHSSVSVITEVLEREEYQLFVANGGQSAIKILEQERINLVITVSYTHLTLPTNREV